MGAAGFEGSTVRPIGCGTATAPRNTVPAAPPASNAKARVTSDRLNSRPGTSSVVMYTRVPGVGQPGHARPQGAAPAPVLGENPGTAAHAPAALDCVYQNRPAPEFAHKREVALITSSCEAFALMAPSAA